MMTKSARITPDLMVEEVFFGMDAWVGYHLTAVALRLRTIIDQIAVLNNKRRLA
jgi:hypothetical protein